MPKKTAAPPEITLDEIEAEMAELETKRAPWTDKEIECLIRLKNHKPKDLSMRWEKWFGIKRTPHAIENKIYSLA